ncbi:MULTISPECIES: MATE family efflux transporter [unclassified Bradyrhizobium]|uniref:MATE family efflux transporter n=1 Tax=unclassified Bradyrhizobium TaxID=2631580 RepID=UPI00201C0599|nr:MULTISPECIES: MATE family efflux transporter [unclassified Bradyrhizobium]
MQQALNAIFVGSLGAQAIAAVSMTVPIIILIGAVGEGIGVGAASFISRHLGSGNELEANRGASTALALATPIGVTMTIALLVTLRGIFVALGASPTIQAIALDYATILLPGSTIMLLKIVSGFIVRAEGNTRYSMWTMLTAFTLNALLDPILIFLLGLGVRVQLSDTDITDSRYKPLHILYFTKRLGTVLVSISQVSLRVDHIRQLALIGAPAMTTSILAALCSMFLYGAAARFGDDFIAAVGIAARILTIGALPVTGFCIGSQAVLGFGWSARDFARVMKVAKFMLATTVALSFAYSVAVMLFVWPLVRLFSDSDKVTEIAVSTCIVFHLFFGLYGIQSFVTTML